MSRSKRIGTRGETAVVRYLQHHGWPSAERRVLAGAQDQGDITGTPGLVWEVKSGAQAESAGDGLLSDWLAETEVERRNARADLGVLVLKRKGFGADRAASWRAYLDVQTLGRLLRADLRAPETAAQAPVQMHLSTAVVLLRAAGYGEPLAQEAAAEVSA